MRLLTLNTPGSWDGARFVCPWSEAFTHVEPGLSFYAVEAWERMTYGGVQVEPTAVPVEVYEHGTAHHAKHPRWVFLRESCLVTR
jgi:hypothetical protein